MLDKICTDLETSKKLKELGIDEKTGFYWCDLVPHLDPAFIVVDETGCKSEYDCKAYTLEQLLNILPVKLPGAHESESNHLYLRKDMWWNVGYPYNGTNCFQISDYNNEGLATIFGKLIIKLKEVKKI